jgi:hypothetical protein
LIVCCLLICLWLFSCWAVDDSTVVVQSVRVNGYVLIVTLSVMVTTFRRIPYISPNPNRYVNGILWVYALYVPLYEASNSLEICVGVKR